MPTFYDTLAELAATLERERADTLEPTRQPTSLGLAQLASTPAGVSPMAPSAASAMGAPPPGALAALAAGGASGGGGGGSYYGQGSGAADITGRLVERAGVTMVAPAIQSLIAAKQATGLPIFRNIGGSFRTYQDQVQMYQNYLNGGNLAAKPGTSNHEKGLAIDFNTDFITSQPALRQWLLNHGWSATVPGEPWHWAYGTTG